MDGNVMTGARDGLRALAERARGVTPRVPAMGMVATLALSAGGAALLALAVAAGPARAEPAGKPAPAEAARAAGTEAGKDAAKGHAKNAADAGGAQKAGQADKKAAGKTADARPDAKSDIKSEEKAEAKAGVKADAKADAKAAAKVGTKPGSGAETGKAAGSAAVKKPPVAIGALVHYKTTYEDMMVDLARKYDIGFVELRAANPEIDPWMPGANRDMVLPTMHILPDAPQRGIVINLPEMRLFHYAKAGEAPASYPIGIGREGLLSPIGETIVRGKREKPTWRPTARMRLDDPTLPEVVPPGPDNPLGTHILYLGWPEYAIHGTNKPHGIGRRSSSGCIRMYPEDIVKLYPAVPENTTVTVVNQPVKAAWIDGRFYIEAQPTIAQADRMEISGGLPTYDMTDDDMKLIMKRAGRHAAAIDWSLARKVIRERRGYPIPVTDLVPEAMDAAGAAAGPGTGRPG